MVTVEGGPKMTWYQAFSLCSHMTNVELQILCNIVIQHDDKWIAVTADEWRHDHPLTCWLSKCMLYFYLQIFRYSDETTGVLYVCLYPLVSCSRYTEIKWD